MTGTLRLTPDELAELVSAVLAYNGYQMSTLALHLEGQLVGYDQAVLVFQAMPLKVRTQPEDQGPAANLARLRGMLYPEVPAPAQPAEG